MAKSTRRTPDVQNIGTTVEVGVEVTILQHYTVEVDKSDPRWVERAVQEAEREAQQKNVGVVTVRGEITDE